MTLKEFKFSLWSPKKCYKRNSTEDNIRRKLFPAGELLFYASGTILRGRGIRFVSESPPEIMKA